jgi:hypothetical protein
MKHSLFRKLKISSLTALVTIFAFGSVAIASDLPKQSYKPTIKTNNVPPLPVRHHKRAIHSVPYSDETVVTENPSSYVTPPISGYQQQPVPLYNQPLYGGSPCGGGYGYGYGYGGCGQSLIFAMNRIGMPIMPTLLRYPYYQRSPYPFLGARPIPFCRTGIRMPYAYQQQQLVQPQQLQQLQPQRARPDPLK